MTTSTNWQAARRTRTPDIPPVSVRERVGPVDHLSADEILARVSQLPLVAAVPRRSGIRLWAVAQVLSWLERHPGDGWQDRWLAGGADRDTQWLDEIVADDPRAPATKRNAMTYGVACLFLGRVVLPGYDFLSRYRSRDLYKWARATFRPDLFARLERAGDELGMQRPQIHDGMTAVTRMVLYTGRDVDQLASEDVHEHREWFYHGLRFADRGVNAAWDLLQHIGVLPAEVSFRESTRLGQHSVPEMVDRYRIRCRPVRNVLVRYLSERAPSLDYASLHGLAGSLAGRFWADIEHHHPDTETLRLPSAVTQAWKQRLKNTTVGGVSRPRKDYLVVLGRVRSFYLDIQEWAHEDPSWAEWAAPSPVRRSELAGMSKARKKTVSEMHQRVRERLPHLDVLVDSAHSRRVEQARLLGAAKAVGIGGTFHHDGVAYRRTHHKSYLDDPSRQLAKVLIENVDTGDLIDVTNTEDDAFWTWAVIETLRHTGIRIEELMEITHLAIVSYRLPDTGEIVPLLQIVPSKSNEERLLLISPELASVLATIVKRLRDDNDGTIPLVARYDLHEKTTGPPLPHLFQRKRGWRSSVMSPTVIKRMLDDTLARTGLQDAAGQPLRFTPHDFRRMFTTEAVTGGLPVHIAAKLLGHRNLDTVESYMAVFQDDLVRTYRTFLDKRRAQRPETEYREPTDTEWHEFQQHFQLRKVALGDCGRPYGSSCQHEHACLRCSMLRVSPQQRPRLIEIIRNLDDRIGEAKMNGWRGEVEGLQVSLAAAKRKLLNLDRSQQRSHEDGPTDLGMPIIQSHT